jgi:hypothetical protein
VWPREPKIWHSESLLQPSTHCEPGFPLVAPFLLFVPCREPKWSLREGLGWGGGRRREGFNLRFLFSHITGHVLSLIVLPVIRFDFCSAPPHSGALAN